MSYFAKGAYEPLTSPSKVSEGDDIVDISRKEGEDRSWGEESLSPSEVPVSAIVEPSSSSRLGFRSIAPTPGCDSSLPPHE